LAKEDIGNENVSVNKKKFSLLISPNTFKGWRHGSSDRAHA
jgi:hypothetical protein